MTDAREYAGLLDDLPRDIGVLVRIVQGLVIHVFWVRHYGLGVPTERRRELQLRGKAQKLARIRELDARPLTHARPPERRLVGNCRDFSLFLVAILRHQGGAGPCSLWLWVLLSSQSL
jgi:hypothetical protein